MKKERYTYHSSELPSVLKLRAELEFDQATLEAAWAALEAFNAPEIETRQYGFERLVQLDVIRKSPLATYILATRILEPEIQLRLPIVRCLAGLISPAPGDPPVAGAVISYLQSYLSQMRTRPIFSLLQVAEFDPEACESVAALLKACSFAGNQLAQIITNHALPVPIRRQAVSFTSQPGFLAAIPALERMVRRIEARYSPGESFLSIPPEQDDEASLLPYMREALDALRAM
jgi:hypothetical protein